MSSALHLQSDGQFEVVCAASQEIGLSHSCAGCRGLSTAITPTRHQSSVLHFRWFMAEPPTLLSYDAGTAKVAAVDKQLRDRDEFLGEVRERLLQAQMATTNMQSGFMCKRGSWFVRL